MHSLILTQSPSPYPFSGFPNHLNGHHMSCTFLNPNFHLTFHCSSQYLVDIHFPLRVRDESISLAVDAEDLLTVICSIRYGRFEDWSEGRWVDRRGEGETE